MGTHVVPWRVGLHGVLGGQGDAAHGNDHEDTHLEVAQVQDVMAQAAKAEGRRVARQRPAQAVVPTSHTQLLQPCPFNQGGMAFWGSGGPK